MVSALFELLSAPRARRVCVVVLALLAPGCGNKNDDDDRPRKTSPPAAEPPPAPTNVPVAEEPPSADPAPTTQPGAAAPAAPAQPGATSTARPGGGKKGGQGQALPPIPTQLVPQPLKPLVPKMPANLPVPLPN